MHGDIVPAQITIFEDRTFEFVLKTSPAASLLKKAAGIEKGSAKSKELKVGKVTMDDIRKIAEKKMIDLNTKDMAAAEKIIVGTARNMGIEIVE